MTTTTSSTILPFVHCGLDGITPFQEVPGCSEQINKTCDWCRDEDSILQMSVRLSTIIWADMKHDPFMYIGWNCWHRSVRINPHFYILDKLVKYIPKDISIVILGYVGDNHGSNSMTQVLNDRELYL
jgi:hypothetical protein